MNFSKKIHEHTKAHRFSVSIIYKLIVVFTISLLFSCASTQKVLSEFDENIDFNSYSSFVICIDDLFVDNINYPNYDNDNVRSLISDAIEIQMINKGHKTNVQNPQLQAGFRLMVEEKKATFTNCGINDEYDYWRECTIKTITYTEETLVVYISDFEKNQIVWQASIRCDLNRSKKRLPEYVNQLIETLYNEYPKLM